MAKRNRGKSLKKMPARGRGQCPVCHKKRIKLLYPYHMATGGTIDVCKNCRQK